MANTNNILIDLAHILTLT